MAMVMALSLSLSLLPAVQAALPVYEVAALKDVFNSANGTGWYSYENWGIGDPCANSWFGVQCDASNSTVV